MLRIRYVWYLGRRYDCEDERDRIMEVAIFGTVDDRFLGVVCGICWFDRERRYDGGGRGDGLLRDGGNW